MNQPEPIEHSGQRILTTDQLAELYGTTVKRIISNFNQNKDKFVEGVHFYLLEGQALKDFKDEVRNSNLVGKNASQLMLWTRRGAARHSKMLGTDQAWDMFDSLEENYFNPQVRLPQTPEEMLALTMQVASRTTERVGKVEKRVATIEEQAPIAPGEYNYINRQVGKAVAEYIAVHHLQLTNKQRGLFYHDINGGLNEYIGIKTRTQLRRQDFDKADEFITNWQPSTATLMKSHEMDADKEV